MIMARETPPPYQTTPHPPEESFAKHLFDEEIFRQHRAGLIPGRATWEFCQYSAATEISDLEQKTFTRSKIERLTALFHSRSNESSSADVVERDGANRYSSPSSLLRLEASTSGSLKKHGNERDNLHAAISTPMVTSRDFVVMTIPDLDLADLYH
ncbi:hypothetical protein Tco_1509822 [Tanacetum coccineum]